MTQAKKAVTKKVDTRIVYRYKIQLGVRGAECYVHRIAKKLRESYYFDNVDLETIIGKCYTARGIDSYLQTDNVYIGSYTDNDCCSITVTRDDGKIVYETDNFKFKFKRSEITTKETHLKTYLIAEDTIKGIFKCYTAKLNKKFKSKMPFE